MNDRVFVGLGKNPDPNGLDMPIGLGMELYQNKTALHYFAALSQEERNAVIKYVEGGKTGSEAKSRVNSAITNLKHRNIDFFRML